MAKVAPAEPQEQPELEAEPIPPRLRPGTSVLIEGVTVLTSEGPIVGAEHERLLDELLHGNGFFIAKVSSASDLSSDEITSASAHLPITSAHLPICTSAELSAEVAACRQGVLPEAMAAEAREKLLARGAALPPSSSKRLHNIIEDDTVFSELVATTHERVGGMLSAVMGEGHYLGSYHALTQYRDESLGQGSMHRDHRSMAERMGLDTTDGLEGVVDQLLARGMGAHSDFPGHQGTAGHLDGLEPCKIVILSRFPVLSVSLTLKVSQTPSRLYGCARRSRRRMAEPESFLDRTSSATVRSRRRTGWTLHRTQSPRAATPAICWSTSVKFGTGRASTSRRHRGSPSSGSGSLGTLRRWST